MPIIEVTAIADLEKVAQALRAQFPKGAIVGLSGELGSGKTTFVRSFIEHHTEKGSSGQRFLSPSFVLQQSYPYLSPPVEHFDFYRLDRVTTETLIEMGYFESAERCLEENGFVFVEWPEHVVDGLKVDVTLNVEMNETSRTFSW